MNLWTYGPHPYVIALTQTIFKVLTAIVSCATAVLLISIIPQVLQIKVSHVMRLVEVGQIIGRHARHELHGVMGTARDSGVCMFEWSALCFQDWFRNSLLQVWLANGPLWDHHSVFIYLSVLRGNVV